MLFRSKYGDGGLLSSYEPSLRDKVNYWLADHWYGDTRQGVEQAKNLSNVLETVTPYGLLTGAYDAGRAGGSGDYLGAGIAGAMTALPLPAPVEKEAKQGIRAFHGSPHSFDRFSMDKIGTGEGAQAYGHGLYFAQDEGVAKSYRDNVKDMGAIKDINARMRELAKIMEKDSGPGYRNFRSDVGRNAAAEYDALMEKRSGITNAPGSMYEVRINANPDDFLDWDKPLSEQPENVRKAFGGVTHGQLSETDQLLSDLKDLGWTDQSGVGAYKGLSQQVGGDVAAAQKLKAAGIPGIKYLDAGSRGAMTANFVDASGNKFSPPDMQGLEGQRYKAAFETLKNAGGNYKDARDLLGETYAPYLDDMARRGVKLSPTGNTRNYVVFDDKLIEIVRKYGIAGAASLIGYNFMQELTPAQQNQLKMIEG